MAGAVGGCALVLVGCMAGTRGSLPHCLQAQAQPPSSATANQDPTQHHTSGHCTHTCTHQDMSPSPSSNCSIGHTFAQP